MYAELSGDQIYMQVEYRQNELVKRVPGRKWVAEHRLWRVPLSWAACMSMRGVFGDELEIGPELNAWAAREVEQRIQPCMALRDAHVLPEDHWVAKRLDELGI